jgi:hypothetical protein
LRRFVGKLRFTGWKNQMNCTRCRGIMVADRLLDDVGRATLFIRRCVLCGEIIDPVILSNRGGQSARRERRSSKLIVWMKPVK